MMKHIPKDLSDQLKENQDQHKLSQIRRKPKYKLPQAIADLAPKFSTKKSDYYPQPANPHPSHAIKSALQLTNPSIPFVSFAERDEIEEREGKIPFQPLIPISHGIKMLPDILQKRLARFFKGVSGRQIKEDTKRLSETYKKRNRETAPNPDIFVKRTTQKGVQDPKQANKESEKRRRNLNEEEELIRMTPFSLPLSYDDQQTLAYVALRLPGSYGCTARALNEIKIQFPEIQPKSIFDFGSGPGTALWAAHEMWPESLSKFFAVEPSIAMTDACQFLAKGVEKLENIKSQRYLFSSEEADREFDLVTATFALSDLDTNKARTSIVRALWDRVAVGGFFVIVESGGPTGFEIVKDARHLLLNHKDTYQSSTVIAPCAHNHKCPKADGVQWCSFQQRVHRFLLQQRTISKPLQNWEDEKFSFVVIQKVGQKHEDIVRKEIERSAPVVSQAQSVEFSASEVEEEELLASELEGEGGEGEGEEEELSESESGLEGAEETSGEAVQKDGEPHMSKTRMRRQKWFEETTRRKSLREQKRLLKLEKLSSITEETEGTELMKIPAGENEADGETILHKNWSRITLAPKKRTGHIMLEACTPNGQLQTHVISKRVKPRYIFRSAHRAQWGDRFHLLPSTSRRLDLSKKKRIFV
eukprot:TRINITY_DN2700_c0_g1_i1.p1 TRINITY_DN2700_c0_g1~~TRINITY_DN2700_c0_g1_i1.p1  ORF type:complete len:677 (+),score=227.32 TRINITY_DN2700_c0_g1_i1:97-2031(+)